MSNTKKVREITSWTLISEENQSKGFFSLFFLYSLSQDDRRGCANEENVRKEENDHVDDRR